MTRRRIETGFSMLEILISISLIVLASSGLSAVMLQSARSGKAKRLQAEAQANARNTLEMVVARLRSAGWDPSNSGLPVLALDPDLSDPVSQIEVFADLNGDGDTDDADEQTVIRHLGTEVSWRPTSAVAAPFEILATHISNDADGDGSPEPMFTPDSVSQPTLITVRITAEAPTPHPVSGAAIRYTLASDVALRKKQ